MALGDGFVVEDIAFRVRSSSCNNKVLKSIISGHDPWIQYRNI